MVEGQVREADKVEIIKNPASFDSIQESGVDVLYDCLPHPNKCIKVAHNTGAKDGSPGKMLGRAQRDAFFRGLSHLHDIEDTCLALTSVLLLIPVNSRT